MEALQSIRRTSQKMHHKGERERKDIYISRSGDIYLTKSEANSSNNNKHVCDVLTQHISSYSDHYSLKSQTLDLTLSH